MSMSKFDFDALIDKLYSEQKNILILDTCTLLDIVRVPIRQKIAVLDSAIEIKESIKNGNFNIVIPSLVPDEWRDNISNVCQEVNTIIRNIHKDLLFLTEVNEKLNLDKSDVPNLSNLNVELYLRDISNEILSNGLILAFNEKFRLLATERVIKNIPPSVKGKDSLKDCIIFEEVLAISEALKSKGFQKKIVFASSNTKEFDKGHIIKECESKGVVYVNSLNWGLNEVK
jgi:hypothetical protein